MSNKLIAGVDHIDIFVDNFDECMDFLKNKLGLEMIRKTTHRGASAEFKTPPMETIIEIHQTTELYNPEVNHIALRVSNVKEAYKNLKEEGVRFDSPPHLVQETGRWVVNARFPDGRRVQLTEGPSK